MATVKLKVGVKYLHGTYHGDNVYECVHILSDDEAVFKHPEGWHSVYSKRTWSRFTAEPRVHKQYAIWYKQKNTNLIGVFLSHRSDGSDMHNDYIFLKAQEVTYVEKE